MKPTRKPTRKNRAPYLRPSLKVSSFTFTRAEADTLTQLTQEQSDLLGRTISRSAVMRALVRLAGRKNAPLELREEIESELSAGRRWGHDSVMTPR